MAARRAGRSQYSPSFNSQFRLGPTDLARKTHRSTAPPATVPDRAHRTHRHVAALSWASAVRLGLRSAQTTGHHHGCTRRAYGATRAAGPAPRRPAYAYALPSLPQRALSTPLSPRRKAVRGLHEVRRRAMAPLLARVERPRRAGSTWEKSTVDMTTQHAETGARRARRWRGSTYQSARKLFDDARCPARPGQAPRRGYASAWGARLPSLSTKSAASECWMKKNGAEERHASRRAHAGQVPSGRRAATSK